MKKSHHKCTNCMQWLPANVFESSWSKYCNPCKQVIKDRLAVEKQCARCGFVKASNQFSFSSKDRLQSYCKSCQSEMSSFYQATRSKEKIKEKSRREWQRRKNDPYYKEYLNQYKEKNKEKLKERSRRYREDNRSLLLANQNNTRAKAKGVAGYIKREDWKFVLDLANYSCLCCGVQDSDLNLDHVIPFSGGGLNIIENTQPLCRRCNMKKGSFQELDFRTHEFIKSLKANCSLNYMGRR